ncbi:unnamed protein product [Paramecium primaurelia]|uniref:Uncharacterized protein n=1 Tax=Paramecium primaurelia TaxID=5886 RepID=A0A8S1M5T8_PARPR|nr:unnamed protein product [Paramecium primaurelia]
MGFVCSSHNHKPQNSKINLIKLHIMIAENFINIVRQLDLSIDIPDDLRYNLNQLIILSCKLKHCIVRLNKRYSDYHFSQLKNELKSVIQYLYIILQDDQLELYFPIIYTFLIESWDIHKQNLKQQVLQRENDNIKLNLQI